MKTNKDFMLRKIAGESILVATGEATQRFNGMITLNEVATFIWENIDACESEDELIGKILSEFDIDEEIARSDAREFIEKSLRVGIMHVS